MGAGKPWPEDDEDEVVASEDSNTDWRAKVGNMLLLRPPKETVEKGVQPFWLGKVMAVTPTGYGKLLGNGASHERAHKGI
jgi:hypothetical protein